MNPEEIIIREKLEGVAKGWSIDLASKFIMEMIEDKNARLKLAVEALEKIAFPMWEVGKDVEPVMPKEVNEARLALEKIKESS